MSRSTTTRNVMLALAGLLAVWGCGGGSHPDSATATPAPATGTAPDAAPAAAGPAAPTGSASITGTITYQGDVPRFSPLEMNADPLCAAKHSEPVYPETLVLGDGKTVGNVFVTVTSGLPTGSYPVPAEPATLDQRGCQYLPHMVGVRVGQPFKILNSDALLHNVHSLSKLNSPFNRAMPGTVTEAKFNLTKDEGLFRVKCDVHPWMSAYVAVTSHPFFAVTAADGKFTLSGLPAGSYQIEAWHERLEKQTATITVGDGEAAAHDFAFPPPAR